METIIRPATDADVAAIMPLWRGLVEFHAGLDSRYRLVPDAAVQVEAHLRAEMDRPDALCLVAMRGPAVAGYCRAAVRERSPIFEERTHGFVSELHVAPDFRRLGVGRGLFEAVCRWLAGQGIHRVELFVLHVSEASRAFWQSVGCTLHGEHRFLELGRV